MKCRSTYFVTAPNVTVWPASSLPAAKVVPRFSGCPQGFKKPRVSHYLCGDDPAAPDATSPTCHAAGLCGRHNISRPGTVQHENTLTRYTYIGYKHHMAIRGFASEVVRQFFVTGQVSPKVGWRVVATVVARKLDMLNYAGVPNDLKNPRGNRLEALKRDLKGLYSIRVNDQWRVIFRWTPAGATEVDVVDYHCGGRRCSNTGVNRPAQARY